MHDTFYNMSPTLLNPLPGTLLMTRDLAGKVVTKLSNKTHTINQML